MSLLCYVTIFFVIILEARLHVVLMLIVVLALANFVLKSKHFALFVFFYNFVVFGILFTLRFCGGIILSVLVLFLLTIRVL